MARRDPDGLAQPAITPVQTPGSSMAGKPTPLLEALRTLGHAIRDAVLAGRARVGDTIPGTTHDADVIRADTDHGPDHQGDTIYRIDVRAEEVVMETAHAWMLDPAHPVPGPFAVIAEGLPGDGWACFPAGTPREAIRTVVIIDPIDGTRGLMHGKRSAWALLASAPGPAILGQPPRLGDLDTAVMAEIPTARARYADTLWATRGNGVRGETLDLATGTVIPARPAPSGATDLSHGFATISKFFPGTKVLASELEERLFAEVMGDPPGGAPLIFDDEYISSGGQLHELIAGHDRFVADLRPYFMDHLEALARDAGDTTPRRRICCRPYDLCTILIAEEAGVIVNDGRGNPVDAPLDTISDVAWAGYANRALANQVQPVLSRLLAELASHR